MYISFGEGDDNRQSFAGRQGSRRSEAAHTTLIHFGDVVLPLISLVTRVALNLDLVHGHAFRQAHRRSRLLNGEIPIGTGGIPVELVMVLKETQLAVGLIGQRIGVSCRRQNDIAAADLHAVAVGSLLDMVGLALAVALHIKHFKTYHIAVAILVAVLSGELAEDAVVDLVVFADHLDGLLHGHRGVCGYGDVAVVGEDPLFGQRGV